MPLVDSPDLEDYSGGIPAKKPEPKNRSLTMRLLIGTLAVIIIILGIINYAQSRNFALVTGRGNVTGKVIDTAGDGIPAEIIVFGTNIKDTADENGYFTLSGIPQGKQRLYITYAGQAIEQTIQVYAAETEDVGTLRIITTLMP